MDKETKKRNQYNAGVVKGVAKRWGVTEHYVRQCLRGDRKGIMCDTLVKDYYLKVKEFEKLLNA